MKRIMQITAALFIVTAVAFVFLFGGCDSDFEQGRVAEKHFTPAHASWIPVTHFIPNGKGGGTTVMNMVYVHHPNRYTIIVHGKSTRGESKVYDFDVKKSAYEKVTIGEMIDVPTLEAMQ